MRRIRVLFRVWFRWVVRYLTGRRFTVPLPDPRKVMLTWIRSWALAAVEAQAARRVNNRDLLTGMVVALTAGPNLPPWSPWEYFKAHAGRPRSNFHGVPYRLVGRPMVVKYPNGVIVGETEWSQDYVPRKEQLAARKRLKQESGL